MIFFFFPVNPKKDSENTPVKGGTVADLGKNQNSLYTPVLFSFSEIQFLW